jgi:hypothetical protein
MQPPMSHIMDEPCLICMGISLETSKIRTYQGRGLERLEALNLFLGSQNVYTCLKTLLNYNRAQILKTVANYTDAPIVLQPCG